MAANPSAFYGPTDYFSGQLLASGETCIPRQNVGTGQTLVSQQVQFTYWDAAKTETIGNLAMTTSSIAAGATPTYCAFGVYQVNADNSLTLLGQCANDTTLFAATFTLYSRAVTTPFQTLAGQRYAMGVLVVSAAAMPNLIGYNGTVADSTKAPVLCRILTAQASLPASVAAGSLAGTSSMYYGELLP